MKPAKMIFGANQSSLRFAIGLVGSDFSNILVLTEPDN